MRRTRLTSVHFTILFVLVPLGTHAQSISTDSADGNSAYRPRSLAAAYDAYREVALTQAQGSQSSSGTTASSQTDLESWVKILLQGGDIGDALLEEFGEIDVNLRTTRRGTWKLRSAINGDPQVYAGLATALDEAQLQDRKAELASELGVLDEYSLEILLSPDDKESVAQLYNKLAYSLSVAQSLHLTIATVGRNEARPVNSIRPLTLNTHSSRMVAQSVDNRDKINFSAKHTVRKGVVGPKETSIAFSFERGLSGGADSIVRRASLNAGCGAIRSGSKVLALSDECLRMLLAVPAMIAESVKKERIAVSIKYSELDAFEFSDPASTFSQSFASTRSFTLSAGYGRNFTPSFAGVDGARLDAALSFEDVKDNSTLNDRGLLQATYTLDFGDFELPISLTWSNKSELVGDSDAKIGGHIGIQFRK